MSTAYAGGTIVNTTFTPGSTTPKADLQSNIIAQLLTAGWSQYSGPANGGANTITVTIASPGVVSFTSHGLVAGDGVVFSTTGALPTGITAGTRYFVKAVLSANTFTISATNGGTVINTTGSQSGTQTMLAAVRMKTAVTPFSTAMIIQLTDNGGTCIQFSVANSNFTLAGATTGQGPGNLNLGIRGHNLPDSCRQVSGVYFHTNPDSREAVCRVRYALYPDVLTRCDY